MWAHRENSFGGGNTLRSWSTEVMLTGLVLSIRLDSIGTSVEGAFGASRPSHGPQVNPVKRGGFTPVVASEGGWKGWRAVKVCNFDKKGDVYEKGTDHCRRRVGARGMQTRGRDRHR